MAQVERVVSDVGGIDPRDDTAVYAAHAQRLVGLAAALAGPSQADDVVANAVMRAMAAPGWSEVRDPGAYLTRAVVNEVRKAHRTDLRREARERRAAVPIASTAAPDPVPEILTALAALPLQQRAAVFLTYWADLAPREVAAHLGIGEGSVRKHLARARATLRKELR
ncbi:MAG: putative polymerase subfamily sigma factor [Acidimicrobiales bacterium]|nr:putative polymerase subfamily sigma factor [Acidimicrobiales bacterium]